MAQNDEFYGVRKGYKSFTDCQDQAGSSVHIPTVHVKEGSHRPGNATYSTGNDCVDSLFARLAACPDQPGFNPQKGQFNLNLFDRGPYTGDFVFRKHSKIEESIEDQPISSNCDSCILEFDGASKGNPGQSGAGAVLRAKDGSMVYQLREGVGFATNNVAEYRALILGLKYALQKGFKHICVQGDSKLVCMQIQGLWKTENQNMAYLCNEARELKDKFVSFQIQHVDREYNSEADAQANLAISLNLKDGQVQGECNRMM